jgi:hypothetical protein
MANVPNVPGVPALSSYLTQSPVLLFADTVAAITQALLPQWGIYTTGGQPVIASSLASLVGLGSLASAVQSIGGGFLNSLASQFVTGNAQSLANLFSVVDFEYKQDWSVSDYPVEQGGFQSYDKVQLPGDIRMRVAAGGSSSNRQALLDIVAGLANSIELFNVYTPEETYVNYNVTHYDYARKANSGAGLIIVDIWLTEIRVTATSAFSNTQQPGNSGQQSLGPVQPSQATGGPPTFQ